MEVSVRIEFEFTEMKTLNEAQETCAKADTGTTFFTHLPVFNYYFYFIFWDSFFEQNTHFNSLSITNLDRKRTFKCLYHIRSEICRI